MYLLLLGHKIIQKSFNMLIWHSNVSKYNHGETADFFSEIIFLGIVFISSKQQFILKYKYFVILYMSFDQLNASLLKKSI